VGAGEIRLAYDQYKISGGKAQKVALGYVHNLSKRTAVYATYARLRNSGGAFASVLGIGTTTPVAAPAFGYPGVNQSSNGYDVGIKHSF
jgi:predicted porin